MKIISHSSHYEIYPDDVKTSDLLPPQTYIVRFNKMSGFFLEKGTDLKNQEEKIYGPHLSKVDKVLGTYSMFERSLGIIASGDKGIGKSLFIQLLSERTIAQGIPVIIVKTAYFGIADFLDSIEQEVLVLFDEFEKVFDEDDDNGESQGALLGLFDGMSQQKRLYALTVNNLNKMSEFMLNRPGRFHYHFRFDYPDASEVTEYLEDKLSTKYHEAINDVVIFSSKIGLNYDCLRAIAFELNLGTPFKEAIKDLNIMNFTNERYDVTFELSDGTFERFDDKIVDLFTDSEELTYYLSRNRGRISVAFNPKKLVVDPITGIFSADSSNFISSEFTPEREYDENDNLIDSKEPAVTLDKIFIKKDKSASLAYAV